MPFFPSSVPTALQLLDARNNKSVTLTGNINDVVTTIPVNSTSDIPTAGYLTFEDGSNEVIQYTGVTPTTLTGVTRGADGTTASSHSNGGTIGMWGNAEYHNILSEEIVAITQNLSDRLGLSSTQILALVGTTSLPGLSWQGDTDTGWHRLASGSIQMVNDGALVWKWDATGQVGTNNDAKIYAALGSNTSPSYSFFSDSNTGIYGNGSDRISFATNGTARVHIDNSGFVNIIGLDLYLASTNKLYLDGGGDSYLYEISANEISVVTNGSERVRFKNAALEIRSGAIENLDGSVSLPAYSFANDPDSGIYRAGSGIVGFVANGVFIADFQSFGLEMGSGKVIQSDTGTALLPPYTFYTDLNTGMYWIGADAIGFTTGGVLRVTIDNSGLTVNSGTLSAAFTFADGSAASPSIAFTADTNTGLYRNATDSFRMVAGGSVIATAVLSGTSVAQFVVGSGTLAEPSLCLAGNQAHGFYRVPGLDVTGTSVPLGAQFGSATNPSYTFAGDENTGMYRSGVDVISFAAGGSEQFKIQGGNLTVVDTGAGMEWTRATYDTFAWQQAGTGFKLRNTTDSRDEIQLSQSGGVSIRGTTTNDSAATGFVGEVVSSTAGTQNAAATGTYDDATSISLTAGDWDISAVGDYENNTATWSEINLGISTTSGNSGAGLSTAVNFVRSYWTSSATNPLGLTLTIPAYRVQLSATTTYYLKRRFVFSVGTPRTTASYIFARRVR